MDRLTGAPMRSRIGIAAGIVLLSPGLAYHNVTVLDSAGRFGNPKMIVHSGEDGADATEHALVDAWKNSKSLAQPQKVVVRKVAGTAHGVKMWSEDPNVLSDIVAFIADVLAHLDDTPSK